jgi:hypothetical protein
MSQEPLDLINAYLDGELTDEQQRVLVEWLRRDRQNVAQFVSESRIHNGLLSLRSRWRKAEHRSRSNARQPDEAVAAAVSGCGCSIAASPAVAGDETPPLANIALFGGVVLSYGIAAAFLCLCVAAAWQWSAPSVRSLAALPQRVKPQAEPAAIVIGKITRATDCRWSRPNWAAKEGESVTRGRRYWLDSGELEITYNIGSKVTLYGPAIFDADGVNCGLLWRGKAVARAVPGANDAMHGGRPPNVDLSDRIPTLFAIRTPYQVDRNTLRYNFFAAMGDAEYAVVVSPTTVRGYVYKGQITTSWAASESPDAAPGNGLPMIVTIDNDHAPAAVAGHREKNGVAPLESRELPGEDPHKRRRGATDPPST